MRLRGLRILARSIVQTHLESLNEKPVEEESEAVGPGMLPMQVRTGRMASMSGKSPPVKARLNAVALWDLLHRLNLSKNEVAELCGLNSNYLSQVVNGRRNASAAARRHLQDVLGSVSMSCSSWRVAMRARTHLPPHLTFGASLLPEDFPQRLNRLKRASGLSWDGMAACLGVDPRQLQRWRQGTAPCGDALFAIFRLAVRVPGGLYLMLPEDINTPGQAGGGQGWFTDL
jgi:transcriptional regulator with XRE-family HTH domain